MSIAAQKLRDYRENVTKFAYEELHFEPDAWQKQVFDVFPSQDPKLLRIALQACAGPGKTAALAICGLNFISCYADRGRHPKGVAISVTADNLKDNLWPELSVWQSRSEFLKRSFTWTKERFYCTQYPETWFLSARSFSKDADPQVQGRTLSGIHADFVLFLIDESGDIPVAVLRAANQARSSAKWFKVLQAGNPTSLEGMLYAAATELSHQWYVIRITGDPLDPNRSPRILLDYANEEIATWGRDNPWVMSYILGTFPPSSINALLGPDEVMSAMGRHLREDAYAFAQKRLGVDVARFGDDRIVIFPRQGLAAFQPVVMRNMRNNEVAARVATAKLKWNSEMEFIDGTGGHGAGVIDCLFQAGHSPVEVNSSSKPIDPRFFNKRSEILWETAQWVKRGGALPNYPGLKRELTAPTYTFQNGKLRVEEKDQLKKRLKLSPDLFDALSLTFALPDMPAALPYPLNMAQDHQRGHTVTEYKPYN